MRFLLHTSPINDQTWRVSIHPFSAGSPAICERTILRAGTSGSPSEFFPFPIQAEAQALQIADPQNHMLTAAPDDLQLVYTQLVKLRDPEPNQVEQFGRYLFYTLIDQEGWKSITQLAGDGTPLELALVFDQKDRWLSRLPWEMMYQPPDFLAAYPKPTVAITRVVTGTTATLADLPAPLKVLFVVGTRLNDPRISPGMEYLGLLRRLKSKFIENSFSSRILAKATLVSLEDAVARFKPDVIHMICHGRQGDARFGGYLELLSSEKPRPGSGMAQEPESIAYSSEDLLRVILRAHQVPVMVVNACYSGSTPGTDLVAPLAEEFVRAGIPIVVGMGGEVADSVCRLFTRRFYEALLNGESLVTATAEGRFSGLTHFNPRQSVDWSFPMLFLAENVAQQITVNDQNSTWKKLRDVAPFYRFPGTPQVFCGREEYLQDAYLQLTSPANQTSAKRVLAVEMNSPAKWNVRYKNKRPKELDNSRYGKTRLLHEIAVQAIEDGHIPILRTYGQGGDDPPSTLMQLAVEILRGMTETRERFGFNGNASSRTMALLQRLIGIPENPVTSYEQLDLLSFALKDGSVPARSPSPQSVRQELQVDLASLAKEARETFPDARVLVLLDEVHRFGEAAQALLNLLNPYGLGAPGEPVPVVFTYSSNLTDSQFKLASEALKKLESTPPHILLATLGPFLNPHEDPVPYKLYLIQHDPPYVICRGAKKEDVDSLLDWMYYVIYGIPSQLEEPNNDMETVLTIFKENIHLLCEANDDELLQQDDGG